MPHAGPASLAGGTGNGSSAVSARERKRPQRPARARRGLASDTPDTRKLLLPWSDSSHFSSSWNTAVVVYLSIMLSPPDGKLWYRNPR